MKTLNDIKDVYGARQQVFAGINLCETGSERKIRGEVGDIIQIVKEDPFYEVKEQHSDEYLVIVAPNTFAYNRGKIRCLGPHPRRKKVR